MTAKACAHCGRPFMPRNRWARFCPAHDYRSPSAISTRDRRYQAIRRRILAAHPACVYCGAPATTIDHVIPVSAGGTNDPDNLVPACRACNNRKSDRSAPGGREESRRLA